MTKEELLQHAEPMMHELLSTILVEEEFDALEGHPVSLTFLNWATVESRYAYIDEHNEVAHAVENVEVARFKVSIETEEDDIEEFFDFELKTLQQLVTGSDAEKEFAKEDLDFLMYDALDELNISLLGDSGDEDAEEPVNPFGLD